jgi:phenylacetate-CoA ligase
MSIWNRRRETMSRDELQQVQLERLQASVNRAYENVAFYKRVFDQLGLSPEDIKSLDDLARLPLTTRQDLRDGYPYDTFAVPLRDVVRIHSSSGTTGAPTVSGYTQNDIHNWSELAARVLAAGGVEKEDVVQVLFGSGLFAAGFGFQYGAELIGASMVPVLIDSPERQIAVMRDFKVTALVGNAGYALSLAERLEQANVNSRALSLRVGLFGGEPWPEKVRAEIEGRLGITATDYYGLNEVASPGVSWECECRCGLHIAEDHFIAEILDPKTGEVLQPGQEGELVLTTLTREALPLIRYRTGDVASLDFGPCECGRTLARMSRIHSRTDDMVIIQGISVFPSQIEAILAEVEGAKPHFRMVIDRRGATDDVEIQVEVSESMFTDTVSDLVEVEERVAGRIRQVLGISPKVRLVEPRTLEQLIGKSRHVVIDKREL